MNIKLGIGLGLIGVGVGAMIYGCRSLSKAVEKQSEDLNKTIKESERMCEETKEMLKKHATTK